MFAVTRQRGIATATLAGRRSLIRTRPKNTSVPAETAGTIRYLHLHEFPSLELLQKHGIHTPKGYLASTPEEVVIFFRKNFQDESTDGTNSTGFRDGVLKAQVLSGGRNSGTFRPNGFQGGVHVVKNPDQAHSISSQMLGQKLVTAQAPEGVVCNQVLLVEKLTGIQRQLYIGIIMDRASQGPLLIGSPMGGSQGSSIVSIARSNPSLIFTESINIEDGLEIDQCERMAENLGLDPGTSSFDQVVDSMQKLYAVFQSCDCTQIEVNPLAEIRQGENDETTTTMIALDAKIQFDDNAAFRQSTLFAQRDYDQEDPREALAIHHGIDYIGLDGSIGCMVNGAGLSMATMDLIHDKGGSPSNFLDVGGGADEKQVRTAFEILEHDPRVKVILVNIFGGLMRCDVIANGILKTIQGLGMQTTPLVIRLQGTNYEEAKNLIAQSGLAHIYLADDLDEAATKAVELAKTMETLEDEDLFDQNILMDDFDDDPLAISSLTKDASGMDGHSKQIIPKFEGFSI